MRKTLKRVVKSNLSIKITEERKLKIFISNKIKR